MPRFASRSTAFEHRQRLEAEEVELHQPGRLDIFHVELGDRHVRARIAVERDQLVERPVADHHAGGVGRGVARQALQLHRQVEQPAHLRVAAIFLGKLADPVQRPLQGPGIGRMVGDQLGQPVDLAVGHLQHPAGVLQHRARLQFPEGDDLRDLVAAVALLDVADHLAAPRFAEVDVEVRHRDALGIEEALEQQAELHRIEIGDGQRPGDHRAGAGAAARPDRNAMLLRPFDEVGDDQEVGGEAHVDDDAGLEVEPVEIGPALGLVEIVIGGEPRLEPVPGVAAQLLGLGLLVAGDARQDRLAPRRADAAAPRDHGAVLDRLGQVGEERPHLRRRLHPDLGRGAQPVVALDLARLGDAEHRVVGAVEGRVDIGGRVGRDQRQAALIGKLDQAGLGRLLDRIAAAAELDIEPPREQGFEPVGDRLGVLALGDQPGERALSAPGQGDQAVGPPFERVERDMRVLLDRPAEMRLGN
jgi:hypothetical protein